MATISYTPYAGKSKSANVSSSRGGGSNGNYVSNNSRIVRTNQGYYDTRKNKYVTRSQAQYTTGNFQSSFVDRSSYGHTGEAKILNKTSQVKSTLKSGGTVTASQLIGALRERQSAGLNSQPFAAANYAREVAKRSQSRNAGEFRASGFFGSSRSISGTSKASLNAFAMSKRRFQAQPQPSDTLLVPSISSTLDITRDLAKPLPPPQSFSESTERQALTSRGRGAYFLSQGIDKITKGYFKASSSVYPLLKGQGKKAAKTYRSGVLLETSGIAQSSRGVPYSVMASALEFGAFALERPLLAGGLIVGGAFLPEAVTLTGVSALTGARAYSQRTKGLKASVIIGDVGVIGGIQAGAKTTQLSSSRILKAPTKTVYEVQTFPSLKVNERAIRLPIRSEFATPKGRASLFGMTREGGTTIKIRPNDLKAVTRGIGKGFEQTEYFSKSTGSIIVTERSIFGLRYARAVTDVSPSGFSKTTIKGPLNVPLGSFKASPGTRLFGLTAPSKIARAQPLDISGPGILRSIRGKASFQEAVSFVPGTKVSGGIEIRSVALRSAKTISPDLTATFLRQKYPQFSQDISLSYKTAKIVEGGRGYDIGIGRYVNIKSPSKNAVGVFRPARIEDITLQTYRGTGRISVIKDSVSSRLFASRKGSYTFRFSQQETSSSLIKVSKIEALKPSVSLEGGFSLGSLASPGLSSINLVKSLTITKPSQISVVSPVLVQRRLPSVVPKQVPKQFPILRPVQVPRLNQLPRISTILVPSPVLLPPVFPPPGGGQIPPPPKIPPVPPPDLFFIDGPRRGIGKSKSIRPNRSSFKRFYEPSVRAIVQNIRGKPSKLATVSGLGLRPLRV